VVTDVSEETVASIFLVVYTKYGGDGFLRNVGAYMSRFGAFCAAWIVVVAVKVLASLVRCDGAPQSVGIYPYHYTNL
jgi:hypothetical protein